jgi:hypothetical protein
MAIVCVQTHIGVAPFVNKSNAMPRGSGTLSTPDVFDVGIEETLSYSELLILGI